MRMRRAVFNRSESARATSVHLPGSLAIPTLPFRARFYNWRRSQKENTATMTDQYAGLTDAERKALVRVSIMAAFADGSLSEAERAEIGRITQKFSGTEAPLSLQEALSSSLATIANDLQSPTAKSSAYEMAVCICNVDRSLSDSE